MKLPNSLLNNFTKKPLRLFYKNDTVDALELIKTVHFTTRSELTSTLNLVQKKQVWFQNLVSIKTTVKITRSLSMFKKSFNEKGDMVLISIVDDYRKQNKLTRLGSNLNVMDINFLRKEKIYAKLKYSRSPQYDIVSGGIAAIFSGFLGFLICEKFGLELLDSGDFYIAFMYAVFIVFSLRPLIRVTNGLTKHNTYTPTYNILSFQPLIDFYTTLIKLVFNFFKY